MRKLNILLVGLFVLLTAGCADWFEEDKKVVVEDVYVTVNFYDFSGNYPGHYRYFTVNNTPVTYSTTLYYNGYESSGIFTFSTDRSIQTYGDYYGKYEITALNLETRRYTVLQYLITAYENGPYGKEVPAVSTFKAKPAPVLDKNAESADNVTSVNVENATLN